MEELKAYVCKSEKDRMIIGIVGLVVGALGIFTILKSTSVIIGIVMTLVGIFLIFEGITAGKRESKRFEKCVEEKSDLQVEQDFADAVSYAEDQLRLGKNILFRKSIPEFLAYQEMKSLHYVERSDDKGGLEGSLFVVLHNGKERKLCELYQSDRKKKTWDVVEVIRDRNPDIIVKGLSAAELR